MASPEAGTPDDGTVTDKTALALELAWGLIANAYHGNWDEDPEWKEAAVRWRDYNYHPWLDSQRSADGAGYDEEVIDGFLRRVRALALEVPAPVWDDFAASAMRVVALVTNDPAERITTGDDDDAGRPGHPDAGAAMSGPSATAGEQGLDAEPDSPVRAHGTAGRAERGTGRKVVSVFDPDYKYEPLDQRPSADDSSAAPRSGIYHDPILNVPTLVEPSGVTYEEVGPLTVRKGFDGSHEVVADAPDETSGDDIPCDDCTEHQMRLALASRLVKAVEAWAASGMSDTHNPDEKCFEECPGCVLKEALSHFDAAAFDSWEPVSAVDVSDDERLTALDLLDQACVGETCSCGGSHHNPCWLCSVRALFHRVGFDPGGSQ